MSAQARTVTAAPVENGIATITASASRKALALLTSIHLYLPNPLTRTTAASISSRPRYTSPLASTIL